MGEIPRLEGNRVPFILSELKRHLVNREGNEARDLICGQLFQNNVQKYSVDIVPIVCKCMSDKLYSENPEMYKCCEDIVSHIATVGNPEEILLELIEQAEMIHDDVTFKSMLKPMQTVLFRLPTRRGQSLQWCLNVMLGYVMVLPLPLSYNLEGEERKLMDLDPCVIRISDVYKEIVSFCDPFVNESSLRHVNPDDRDRTRERDVLLDFLVRLLGRPLAFLDLECDGCQSSIRVTAEYLVHYITLVVGDIVCFLNDLELKKSEADSSKGTETPPLQDATHGIDYDEDIPDICLANLYYLVFSEGASICEVPFVYNHMYILERCLYLSSVLLKTLKECAVSKGLQLTNTVLERVDVGSVGYEFGSKKFVFALVGALIYCEVKELRTVALNILQQYIKMFDTKGKYLTLTSMFSWVDHSGVAGCLIVELKNIVNNTLRSIEPCSYFTGKKLFSLILKACSLPKGAESDLLDQNDRIVSSLNLFRFLLLADFDNKTGVWDHISKFEESFLKPLQSGITLSRAHYQLKLREIQEEKKSPDGKSDCKVSLTVGGSQLPKLPAENQIAVVNSALNAFDLLESLLGRVNEVIVKGASVH